MAQTIEKLILEGTGNLFSRYYRNVIDFNKEGDASKRDLPAAFIETNKLWQVLEKVKRQQNTENNLQFPFLYFSVMNLSLNMEGYRPKAVATQTLKVPAASTNSTYLDYSVRIVPTNFNCTCHFVTDDFWQAFSFSSMWIHSVVDKKGLNFNATFHGAQYSIQIMPETEISFPQKDDTVGIPNVYTLEANFTIRGYTSDNRELEEMPTTTRLKQLNVGTAMVDEGERFSPSNTKRHSFRTDAE